MTINTNATPATINWQQFSIGAGGSITITQPGASTAVLNRVTATTPSQIQGNLIGSGTIQLTSPGGISVTTSGVPVTTGVTLK